MNLVYITLDSLNRHMLPLYGPSWVHTPNLERLAARGVVFDGHYAGSLPCMPARREMWTGTEECWWRWWGPVEPWDRPLAYELGRQGVTSQLITDHYTFSSGAPSVRVRLCRICRVRPRARQLAHPTGAEARIGPVS